VMRRRGEGDRFLFHHHPWLWLLMMDMMENRSGCVTTNDDRPSS